MYNKNKKSDQQYIKEESCDLDDIYQDQMDEEEDQQQKCDDQSTTQKLSQYQQQQQFLCSEKKQMLVCVILHDYDRDEQFKLAQLKLHVTDQNEIRIQELIDQVFRIYFEINFKDQVIFIYDEAVKMYVYAGEENDMRISVKEVRNIYKGQFTIRHQSRNQRRGHQIHESYQNKQRKGDEEQQCQRGVEAEMSDEKIQQLERERYIEQKLQENKCVQAKRVKERTIQFAKEIVQKWREVYQNSHCCAEKLKLNLNEAAKIVGLSRKTLDDYNLQIKRGQQNGFDFDAYLQDKIGVLRKFNKMFQNVNCVEEEENDPEDAQNPLYQENENENFDTNLKQEDQISQNLYPLNLNQNYSENQNEKYPYEYLHTENQIQDSERNNTFNFNQNQESHDNYYYNNYYNTNNSFEQHRQNQLYNENETNNNQRRNSQSPTLIRSASGFEFDSFDFQ